MGPLALPEHGLRSLSVEHGGGPARDERVAAKDGPGAQDEGSSPCRKQDEQEEDFPQCLFVRRSPEAYAASKLGRQSSLTIGLRQQAQSSRTGLFAEAASRGQGDGCVCLNVHLPVRERSGCQAAPVNLKVPAAMRVVGLREEIVRQYAHLEGFSPYEAYELRLWDDEEQEPDYDCPPFDENLQVSVLNVTDVALAKASSTQPNTPLPPAMSQSMLSDSQASSASVSSNTPTAAPGGILKRPRLKSPSTSSCSGDENVSKPSCETEAPPTDDLRRKNCRSRSFPQLAAGKSELLADILNHLSGFDRLLEDAERSSCSRKNSKVKDDGKRKNSYMSSCGWENSLPLKGAGIGKRGEAQPEPIRYRTLELLLTDGPDHVQDCSAALELAGTYGNLADVVHGPSTSWTRTPTGLGCERVMVEMGVDSTLCQVLERLSRDRCRTYDPVHFEFERTDDDDVRQKLDIHTKVKHLPQSTNKLMVVRKDASMLTMMPSVLPQACFQDGGSLPDRCLRNIGRTKSMPQLCVAPHQPSASSSLFLNEYVKAIPAEYVLQVGIAGAANAKPSTMVDCVLAVDRHRLVHRASLTPPSSEPEKTGTGAAFVPSLLRSVKRHLQNLKDGGHNQFLASCVYKERSAGDIVSLQEENPTNLSFRVTYATASSEGTGEASTVTVVYMTQTPTECSEVFSRLQFLRSFTR
eukprot:TRINITY_DN48355_c0_g1_i1.p1 TRINITY_DN48355_c0_g1~~TRINITY_DN48355_c0_g1_i1.p1  ORF type:complete len:767 (-),score=115.34 TRINITY_DN48355_c0_g1_i1:18-2096(-)